MTQTRRSLLLSAAAAAAVPRLSFAQGAGAPAVVTSDRARPAADWGVLAGDVTGDRALIWSRADRPTRMVVEWSTTEGFQDPRRVVGPHALEDRDFTAKLDLTGLPPGQDIFYRVTFLDLGDLRTASVPVPGRFRTPPSAGRDVVFTWSGDTCGQGWGIDRDRGGFRAYEAMRGAEPDLFIHCGDTIYADGPLEREVSLPDRTVWRNLVTEEKSKVAETLGEFRGNHRYNLLDENVRRFNASTAQVWQWDDHEVTNNWSDSKDLSADERYREKRVPLLTARASRAFLEYAPIRPRGAEEAERVYRRIAYGPHLEVFVIDMRSYRGPNTHNRQEAMSAETAFLGRPQIEWLKRGLLRSRATWKVIAADMPIGLQVPDGRDAEGRPRFEAVANGDGPALGREIEIAGLLSFIKHAGIRDVVWVTADTHYTGAHRYEPAWARYADFEPFWEFMSGPLHAGTFGPNPPDDTFGMRVMFQKAPPEGQRNVPPTAGLQFFGEGRIEGRTGALTVRLRDVAGATLWQTTLEPHRA